MDNRTLKEKCVLQAFQPNKSVCFILSSCLADAHKSRKGRDPTISIPAFAPLLLACSIFSSLSSFHLLTLCRVQLLDQNLVWAAQRPLFLIPMVKLTAFKIKFMPPSCRLWRLLCVQSWIPTGPHELSLRPVVEPKPCRMSTLSQRRLQEGDQVSKRLDSFRRVLLPSLQRQGVHSGRSSSGL